MSSSHQSNKDKPHVAKCIHFCHSFDTHYFCPTCREAGNRDDPCVTLMSPREICTSFTEEQLIKISHRKRYIKRGDKKSDKSEDIAAGLLDDNSIESFGGSQAELKVAAEHLFTFPPRPQPLAFEALSLRTPTGTVTPTPGMVLQLKVQSNLEKSLGSRFDMQVDQKMGSFQASMLEAFNSLRESKQVEVDQTSASVSKPKKNPSHSKNLDPSKTSAVELIDVDYGPELTPHLDCYDSRVDDASGHPLSSVEEPLRVASTRPKKSSYSHKQYDVHLSSALDHYSDPADDPQPTSSRPKKHSDKSKHRSRSRFLPSSSGGISSLNVGIGLPSPLGSLTLIRTIHNMTLILLITGK